MTPRRFVPLILGALLLPLSLVALPGTAVQAASTVRYPGNGSWQPGPETYGSTEVKNIPVTMPDGATLRANVGYPSDKATGKRAAGTFPVLVSQVPYLGADVPFDYFVKRGYIYVAISVRGTQESTGPDGGQVANPFFGPTAGTDGAAVVDWAAHRLSGSNGVVGLAGCSFFGINQLFTAAALKPGSPVKAMIPACSSFGYTFLIAGGVPGVGISALGTNGSSVLFGPANLDANNRQNAAMAREIMAGGPRAYNRTYWRERTTDAAMAARIVANDIPTLLWTGWDALDGSTAPQFFSALQNAWAHRTPGAPMTPGQPVTGRYQMIVGPWAHGVGLDLGIMLEWYDTWLKGANTGMADTTTPLHANQKQDDRWVNAHSYPLVQTGTLYQLGARSTLATGPAGAAGADRLDYTEPESAHGTLTYTSGPFTADKDVAGPVAVSIGATSSTRNADFIAVLEDVAPGGSATTITRGTLLGSLSSLDEAASWRDANGNLSSPAHPFDRDRYVPAGQWHRYDIALNPTLHRVAAGHSVRLRVTSKSTAIECTSLLLYAAPCTLTTPQQATVPGGRYRISFGGGHPSTVNLPLVDPSALTTARSGSTPDSIGLVEPLGW